jgi:hypothetical protein
LIVIAGLFPAGFLMGQLFPQGLRKVRAESIQLVPWAWAINGAASTIAAGVGIFLARPLGFNFVVSLGAFCYCVIFFLPNYSVSAPRNE